MTVQRAAGKRAGQCAILDAAVAYRDPWPDALPASSMASCWTVEPSSSPPSCTPLWTRDTPKRLPGAASLPMPAFGCCQRPIE